MTHTWGIPGPTFLAIYLIAAAVLIVGTILHRRRLFAGDAGIAIDSLNPQQLAYLTGGPQLAVQNSLLALKNADAITIAEKGTLSRTGYGSVPEATALDSAILHAAGAGLRTRHVADETNVRRELHNLRQQLEQAGLAIRQDAALSSRRGPLLLAALFAIGVVRLISGASDGKPVGYLVLSLILVLVATIFFFARRPKVTTAATSALKALRHKYSYLAPTNRPALNSYGVAGTAMAVGLFGGAMLWQADPAFADAAEFDMLGRNADASSGTGYVGSDAGSGGGDGGGDGGGGGGCGGGCGG